VKRARSRLGAAIALLVLPALVQTACIEPAKERYQLRVEATAKPLQHAVHSERLRQIMAELQRLSTDRLPQEMDMRSERRRQIDAVARVAAAMAETADAIPDAATADSLSEPERREFLRLARDLRDRSLALSERAAALSPGETARELSDIYVTCGECHGKFRIPLAETAP